MCEFAFERTSVDDLQPQLNRVDRCTVAVFSCLKKKEELYLSTRESDEFKVLLFLQKNEIKKRNRLITVLIL